MSYVYHYEQSGFLFANIDDPSAGADFTWTNPENTPIRILYIKCQLITSVAVDDRILTLSGHTGSNQFGTTLAPGRQPPGKTRVYYFSPCILGIDGGDAFEQMWAPLSSEFWLLPDDKLQSAVAHLKIGDQLSAIQLRYRQELPNWLR